MDKNTQPEDLKLYTEYKYDFIERIFNRDDWFFSSEGPYEIGKRTMVIEGDCNESLYTFVLTGTVGESDVYRLVYKYN